MKQNIVIQQGSTFLQVLRWESSDVQYLPIVAITQAAPAVVTTSSPHGLPDGWRAAFVSCDGMEQVNANVPPRDSDFRSFKVLNATTLLFPTLDTADFDPYTGGGYLQFYLPQSLAGNDARMSIRDRIRGSELLALTVSNGRILLDDVLKTITLNISATDTAAIDWTQGVYDLELVGGVIVTRLLEGSVKVSREVTI